MANVKSYVFTQDGKDYCSRSGLLVTDCECYQFNFATGNPKDLDIPLTPDQIVMLRRVADERHKAQDESDLIED